MADESSIFIQTFGDYPALRIIDFLIGSSMFDYPITDIAKNSGVHFQTFQKIWPGLVKKGFVVRTRKLGNSSLYKINKGNAIMQKLIELDDFLCKQYSNKAIKIKVLARAKK
jgi:predicted transcriptional regulator